MTKEEKYREWLLGNRVASLTDAWQSIVKMGLVDSSKFALNPPIVVRVVLNYISNLESLKVKCGITKKVQFTKIAGLMASSILKFRPVVPRDGLNKSEDIIENNDGNEILAIFQGIVLSCIQNVIPNDEKSFGTEFEWKSWEDIVLLDGIDEYQDGEEKEAHEAEANKELLNYLFSKVQFKDWHKKFVYLLKEQDHTSESLIMIFETLKLALPDKTN